ncbi:S41 family peptidase [Actinomadura fulvescens]|uniref:S41 family peptidase n=1 Tax=Actinomadura fulvescens TaxID=46160 RepID=A0ABN3QGW8_9ACTN
MGTALTMVVAGAAAVTVGVPTGAMAGTGGGPGSVEGIWQTDGYSMVMAIEHGRLQAYDTTSVSCLKGVLTGRRDGPAGREGTVRFVDHEQRPTMTMRPHGHRLARMQGDGSVGEVTLRRLPRLPKGCEPGSPPPGKRDPVKAFDVFWTTFAENYPFFAAKGIDWRAVRDRYRPRIGPDTTDDQLFGVLRAMIEPLGDAHTGIQIGERTFDGIRPGTRLPTDIEAFLKQVQDVIEKRDTKKPLTTWAQGSIGYADLPGRLGYLRVLSFAGYTEADSHQANAAELDRALDQIFHNNRLRGLILDLRINGGGSDALGLRLAARFTTRPYLAYTKKARNDPADPTRFTRPQPLPVRPNGGPGHTGPIALLTGPLTISAAETFTQAMIGRTPAPRRIGENTQGVFSDTMTRVLPNGGLFRLPNELYLTKTGTTFDGAGIPPHTLTPGVFSERELNNNQDSAFDAALNYLNQR